MQHEGRRGEAIHSFNIGVWAHGLAQEMEHYAKIIKVLRVTYVSVEIMRLGEYAYVS